MSWTKQKRKRWAATMRRRNKDNEIKRDADGEWYSLQFAARYVQRSVPTLMNWKQRCPVLGRGIHLRKFSTGGARLDDYFFKPDLDEAKKKLTTLSLGTHVLTWEEACEQTGTCQSTIASRVLPMRKKTLGRRANGRPLPRVTVDKAAVAAFVEYREQMTIPEAARALGVDRSVLDNLIAKGLLQLLPDPFGYKRFKRVDRSRVEEVAKQLNEAEPVSIVDGLTYLPYALAMERFPDVKHWILYRYAGKPCPQLEGDIFRAKKFRPVIGKRGGWNAIWKWSEDDLGKLGPAHRGQVTKKGAPECPLSHDAPHEVIDRAHLQASIRGNLEMCERLQRIEQLLAGGGRPQLTERSICPIEVRDGRVFVEGLLVNLDMTPEREADTIFLLTQLIRASGQWRSGSDLGRIDPTKAGTRFDRIVKSLPQSIRKHLETSPRLGTRITVTPLA